MAGIIRAFHWRCAREKRSFRGDFHGRRSKHPGRGSRALPGQREDPGLLPQWPASRGRPQVSRIVSGVTASQALLDAAVEAQADLVLVHHGYFWKGENPCITGIRQRRLKTLLNNDISLLAFHLPLDVHPEVGNNVQLARQLDITVEGPLDPENPKVVGLVGSLAEPVTARDFARRFRKCWGVSHCWWRGSR